MRIRTLLEELRDKNQKAFIPYITVGDPSLKITEELIIALINAGADMIELGVPFSDPIADGPINQRSHERALKNNVNLKDCCLLIKKIRTKGCTVPVIIFSYLNPILRMGVENFAKLAASSGVDAALIVDLPIEEAAPIIELFKKEKLGFVLLASPTTSRERINSISLKNPEFLYYIARKGVTGIQGHIPSTLPKELAIIKEITDLPIAIGFGISNAMQASMVAKLADAVIIGSALVALLEKQEPQTAKLNFSAQSKIFSESIKNSALT